MQRPDLQAIAAKWIAELRLQDRIITVRYVANLSDPFGNLVYGLMTILNLDEGRFLIEVQDPETWPAGGSRPLSAESIEEGIVHELVHIRWIDLTACNPNPTALVQEERATWATARALVRANSSQRAAMVRAMVAKQRAATRQQTKGTGMDAKAVLAAIKDQDEAAALAILEQWLAEQIQGGASGPPSVQDPNAPPMNADAGNGDPQKDKPPMNMGDKQNEQYQRAMKADMAEIRTMKAELVQCLEVARPAAKTELVRTMRADGIALTSHQEKLILEAKTIEEAKTLERGMRAMGATPSKPPARQPADESGLTSVQATKYRGMVAQNNPRAEAYRDECVRLNSKKGGAK